MSKRTSVYQAHPSTQFQCGDLVSCDWNHTGHVTVHRILWKRTGERGSQTGTVFKVTPPVHKPDPALKGYDQGWIDAAWFFKDGLEVL